MLASTAPTAMFCISRLVPVALCLLLLDCASTKVTTSGEAPKASLCQSTTENLSVLVLWGAKWRPNQKEVARRELAAQQGLENYFAKSGCFSRAEIRRLPDDKIAQVLSMQEIQSLASVANPSPDRVIMVVVRELGPVIKLLGSPAILEGGTEVILEVTAVDLQKASSPLNFRVHWQNGGPLAIKGVATLPQDMTSALGAAMSSGVTN